MISWPLQTPTFWTTPVEHAFLDFGIRRAEDLSHLMTQQLGAVADEAMETANHYVFVFVVMDTNKGIEVGFHTEHWVDGIYQVDGGWTRIRVDCVDKYIEFLNLLAVARSEVTEAEWLADL